MSSVPENASPRGPDIFVGGPPRSGTTILQRILCQSQYTNPMVGEAEHFFYLVRAYTAGLGQFNSKTKFYYSKEELREYHKNMAENYLERFRAKFGGDVRLVLKAPWFTSEFPQLAELLPDALFVVIARDTLDIVASQIEVGIKQQANIGVNFYPRDKIQKILEDINSIYLPVFRNKNIFKGRLITVRYEKLVSGDVALKRLMKFLQLPDLMSAAQETNSGLTDFRHDADRAFYTKLWDQEMTNSRIGRHKEILTPQEIDAVIKGTKRLRRIFGYE